MIFETIIKILGISGTIIFIIPLVAFMNHQWITKEGLPKASFFEGEQVPPRDELNDFGKKMHTLFYVSGVGGMGLLAAADYFYGWS